MRKYMYLISILILSSCQVADVQNGTEKKDNFLQEVGRLSDFVLSQSKVGGYLSEEDAVILDNWLKELSTRYDFQNNFDYCGDIYTRSDYEPDFYDYLNWIEENATSGFYQIIYRWLVDEEFDDDLNQILANTILLPNEQVAIAVVYPLVQNSLVEFESRGGADQCYDQYNSDIKRCKRDYHITMAVVTAVSVLSGGSAAPAAAVSLVGNTVALKSCMDGAARTFDICVKYAK